MPFKKKKLPEDVFQKNRIKQEINILWDPRKKNPTQKDDKNESQNNSILEAEINHPNWNRTEA